MAVSVEINVWYLFCLWCVKRGEDEAKTYLLHLFMLCFLYNNKGRRLL